MDEKNSKRRWRLGALPVLRIAWPAIKAGIKKATSVLKAVVGKTTKQ
jgi:hypothetical protein